jgi:hypothetical protein
LEKARNEFLNTLSVEDRLTFSACSSPGDLIGFVEKLQAQSKRGQKRIFNRCLNAVKKLNHRLLPYFDALNVVAGADKTAALAYGGFRVVLQLASCLPTFFEKLISVLSRLTDTFPQYDTIVRIFGGDPPARIRQHLERVYKDLFQFLHIAARIFKASNGRR